MQRLQNVFFLDDRVIELNLRILPLEGLPNFGVGHSCRSGDQGLQLFHPDLVFDSLFKLDHGKAA